MGFVGGRDPWVPDGTTGGAARGFGTDRCLICLGCVGVGGSGVPDPATLPVPSIAPGPPPICPREDPVPPQCRGRWRSRVRR